MTIPVQYTIERLPELKDVPTLIELTPPDKKDIVEFFVAGTPISRGMAVGPGVPKDRVEALRKAFDETMKDPAFLAEMKKLDLEVRPQSGAKVEQLVKEVYSYPPDVVKIAADAIRSAR